MDEIEDYIQKQCHEAQAALRGIRALGLELIPNAIEKISYGMPTFFAPKLVFHYGAFKKHIGLYPPLRAPEALVKETALYANEKDNLAFPLDAELPMDLIARVIEAHYLSIQKTTKPA